MYMEGVSRGQLIQNLVTAGQKHGYKISVFVSMIQHFGVRGKSNMSLFNFIVAIFAININQIANTFI